MRATVYASCMIMLALGGASSASAQQCLPWGGNVELSGFVIEGVYPGPPEYTSVAAGDEALTATLLHLSEPVCIDGEDELAEGTIAATELVQLACGKKKLPVGEVVTVSGQLFPRHTGYHVTPALLACE